MEINIQNSKKRTGISDLVTRWLVNALGLVLAAWWIPGIHLESGGKDGLVIVLATSAILGLLHTAVKPVLLILTLPITLLTLGLFFLVINGAMLALASAMVPGFNVDGFWAAVLGALLLSVFSTFFGGSLQGGFKVKVERGGKDA